LADELHDRAERFSRDIAEIRVAGPGEGAQGAGIRKGGVTVVGGLLLCIVAVIWSASAKDEIAQQSAFALGLLGVATLIVGAAVLANHALSRALLESTDQASRALRALAARRKGSH
jgi:hypothetical protein